MAGDNGSGFSVVDKRSHNRDGTLRSGVVLTDALPEGETAIEEVARSAGFDYFSNFAARMGYGTSSLPEGTEYQMVRLSYNYFLMLTLYRNSWVSRRIVDLPASDMTRAWCRLESDLEPDDIQRFDRIVARTHTVARIQQAVKWARLYGGAGCLMCIKGHEDHLDEPLDIDDVSPHSFLGLIPFDRWVGIWPYGQISSDFDRPNDFGLPEFYQCTLPDSGQSFMVHSSRILRFLGPEVPKPEFQAQMYWGISVLELAFEELKKRDNASWSMLQLLFRAQILAQTNNDLAQFLSGVGSSQQALEQFYKRMAAQNQLLSNQSMLILPKDGQLFATQYSFSGLGEVYAQFQMDVAGAAQIPVTRLFGRTITGLGQSNDADERYYEETIAMEQDSRIRPQVEKLYPVICMSEFGDVPDDLDFKFPSVRVLTEEEKGELADKWSAPVLAAYNAGVIGKKTALKELRQLGDSTGIFTNITDEMIDAASDEPEMPGEEMGGFGGQEGKLPEEGSGGLGGGGVRAKGQPKLSTHGISIPSASSQVSRQMEREALGKPAEEGDRKRTLADKIKSMVAQLAGRKPKVRKFRDEETDGGGGMEGLKDLLDAWDPKLHPRAASGQKAGQSVPQGQGGVTSFTRHEPTKHDRPKREESALTKLKRARGEPQEKEVGPDVVAAFLKKEGWTPEDHKRDFSIWSKGAKMLAVRYDGNQVRDATLAEAKEGNGGPHFETRQGFQGLASLGQEKGEARDAASLPEIEPESTGATASKKGAVDQAAPLRSDLEPTKDARSIPKRATWHGLDVSIETPAGKERVGHSAEGLEWRVRMSHDYGYIRRTEGVDGDHVDVFLGPDPKSETVYVVTTLKSPGFKEPDEQKCMLDFPSEGDASKAFFDSYTDPRHFGSMEAVPVGQFIDKVLATKKKPEMIAKDGAWGTASYENDHAQDVLDIFRNHDKGSHDEGFREPVQESNLQNFLAYLDSIPTDDDFGKEKYLGPVILQAKESTDLPARYLAKAAEIIDGFLANESYLWKWKDPEARRASLEEERSFISKLLERHAKTGSTKPEKVADDAPWREEAHPRVKGGEGGGQFTSKGGEGAKAQEPEKPERAPRSASAVGKRGAPPR